MKVRAFEIIGVKLFDKFHLANKVCFLSVSYLFAHSEGCQFEADHNQFLIRRQLCDSNYDITHDEIVQ